MHEPADHEGAAPPGYRLVGLLGFGPTGQVWRAVEIATDAEVAARLVRRPTRSGAELSGRLRELSGRLQRLGHPHVLGLRRVLPGQRAGEVWCVADLAAGGSLAALLARRGTLSPGEVVTIGAPVAEALQAMHARGLAHGRMHASNILLTADGRPLLSDAGLAEALLDPPGPEVSGALLDPTDAVGAYDAETRELAALLEACLSGTSGQPGGEQVLRALHAPAGQLAQALRAASEPTPVLLARAGAVARAEGRSRRHVRSAGSRAVRSAGSRAVRPQVALLAGALAVAVLGGGLRLEAATWAVEPEPPQVLTATTPAPKRTPTATTPAPTGTPFAATPGIAGIPSPAAAAWSLGEADDPLAALQALDHARSVALARVDAGLLRSLYLPGAPALEADLALLRRIAASGERPDGYQSQVREAVVLRERGDAVTLRVTDVVMPFAVRAQDGALLRVDPGRGERSFEVDLVRLDGRWRYSAVRVASPG